jgi:hypothetical protein
MKFWYAGDERIWSYFLIGENSNPFGLIKVVSCTGDETTSFHIQNISARRDSSA